MNNEARTGDKTMHGESERKPVNVLAVIHNAAAVFNNPRFTDRHRQGPALQDAHDAVAELIAAARLAVSVGRITDGLKDALARATGEPQA